MSKIYFTVDENFLSLCLVPISQLQACGREIVIVNCGDSEIPDWKKKKVKKSYENVSFFRIPPEKNPFKALPFSRQEGVYPSLVYVRFLLPYFFPKEKDGLYLDSDIFIRGNVNDIFDYGIGEDEYVAGVCDLGATTNGKAWVRKCNVSEYINTGVLLINFSLFRKNYRIINEMFDYAQEELPYFPDQDTINDVLRGKKRILPLKWNISCYAYWEFGKDFINDVEKTAIYHYCGEDYWNRPHKLENAMSDLEIIPFAKEWREILEKERKRVGI